MQPRERRSSKTASKNSVSAAQRATSQRTAEEKTGGVSCSECSRLIETAPLIRLKSFASIVLYLSVSGPAHLGVSAVVLQTVLQHPLILLHQVVPALVGGWRCTFVARGDR